MCVSITEFALDLGKYNHLLISAIESINALYQIKRLDIQSHEHKQILINVSVSYLLLGTLLDYVILEIRR